MVYPVAYVQLRGSTQRRGWVRRSAAGTAAASATGRLVVILSCYAPVMVAERLSLSLSAEAAAAVRKAAADAGMSVSGWVEQTVGSIARRQAGLRAMDDYEAEHGAFTQEEREQARRTLRKLGLLDVRAAG
jgi:hypothetical protein